MYETHFQFHHKTTFLHVYDAFYNKKFRVLHNFDWALYIFLKLSFKLLTLSHSLRPKSSSMSKSSSKSISMSFESSLKTQQYQTNKYTRLGIDKGGVRQKSAFIENLAKPS